MKIFHNKIIVITGGTGSLGKVLTRRILQGIEGKPTKIIIFSRDEAKQHYMRLEYLGKNIKNPTDEVIYNNFRQLLEFRIGDIRDFHSVVSVLKDVQIVINAAALKQVPTCEYFPFEAVSTNIIGTENIIRAIKEFDLRVETVLGVSTDKACQPINVMGMTKALQERLLVAANVIIPKTRFICIRYGNVLASRGSVIPLFHEQIKNGGPVTITTKEMTRFLMTLERAVDTVFAAIGKAKRGEIFIPIISSAKMVDVAKVLIGKKPIKIIFTGIRPGEKNHETMISSEEAGRVVRRGDFYAISPMLPELQAKFTKKMFLQNAYTSQDLLMKPEKIKKLFDNFELLEIKESESREVLR